MSQPIYLSQDIRRIEQANPALPLMERAGAAAAELAARLLSDSGKDVLILAGPGNNGGDARIVERILKERFFRTSLIEKPEQLPKDKNWNLVVDGLFGIGLARPVDGEYAKLVDYANAQSCPVLALDIPSGLHSDSGQVLGRAVRATHTITFIGLKPGLLTLDGPDHCGQVTVADLAVENFPSGVSKGWVGRSRVVRQRPQAPAEEFPQRHGRLGRHHRRHGRHGRRGAARRARRAQAGRGPRLLRHARDLSRWTPMRPS